MVAMKMGSHLLFLVLSIVLVCSLPGCHGKSQGEALSKLIKDKLGRRSNANFDASLYETPATSIVWPEAGAFIPQAGSKDQDRITKLPGQPPVDFNQYGGYITVNSTVGRALYYYFAEATGYKQDEKPLLIWLNGGPGCSSLGYGAMQELGPFRVKSDGKTLYRNPFSWNKVANVLFLESPAGVGFSYSNNTEDYQTSGDGRTAADSFLFIVNWLKRFPEYKNRDVYIAGESYAGHYVPQFAHSIVKHNELAKKTIVNLKGIMIGNGVINDETDWPGMYEYFWSHALISDEAWHGIKTYCDFSPNSANSDNCTNAQNAADDAFSELDIYNIYAPQCHSTNVTSTPKPASVLRPDPCSNYYVYNYLNLPEVQKAMHGSVTKVNNSWEPCSNVITKWADSPATMLPFLHEFLAKGLRVWVMSGDTDGRVPVTGTRYSINAMNLPVTKEWKAWIVKNEVGGYSVTYKGGLVLFTIRGAGHMVPTYQPMRALVMADSFVRGKQLPEQ